MALNHNNTLLKTEPSWDSIDEAKLPRNAYGDMGEVGDKSTYLYPHHHVDISGDMHLHRGGLKAALQATGGLMTGQKEKNPSVKRHLTAHADAIGMDRKETAALLNMSAESLADFLNNDNNNTNNLGGENTMGMTYEELETEVKDLKKKVSEQKATMSDMETDAEALATTVSTNTKALETEIEKNVKSEETLTDKIDDLEKTAKDNKVFIEAGKTSIEDMKAEISKISAQVDGDSFNKELVDKQLEAFGTDVTALTQFKDNLESRRAKLFKTGEIHADAEKDDKTKEQEDYAIGQGIGKGNVIPIR